MNFRLLSHTMGYILWVEAGFLLLPALTACIYAETCWQQFLLTALLCAAAGTVLHLIPVKKTQMHSRDGFAAVALSWVLLAGALVVSWDNYGFQESFAASLTCISNVGPGLGILGPMENFSILSPLSKLVLSLEMLMGRLELMPLLALFLGSTWRD